MKKAPHLILCMLQEPLTLLMYPVIDDMANWVKLPFASGEYNADEHHLGGMLQVGSYWREWIKGVLPKGKWNNSMSHQGGICIHSPHSSVDS